MRVRRIGLVGTIASWLKCNSTRLSGNVGNRPVVAERHIYRLPIVRTCYLRRKAISDSISRLTSHSIARTSAFQPDVTAEEHTTPLRFVPILCLGHMLFSATRGSRAMRQLAKSGGSIMRITIWS